MKIVNFELSRIRSPFHFVRILLMRFPCLKLISTLLFDGMSLKDSRPGLISEWDLVFFKMIKSGYFHTFAKHNFIDSFASKT